MDPGRHGGLRLSGAAHGAESGLLAIAAGPVEGHCAWVDPLAGRAPFPPEALAQYPFILLEEGDDYEIQEVLDTLGVQPNVQYRVQQDQVILAMVSCGLGISIMEELMLEQNEYPVVACSFAKPFYRNIGICVKDKRAISRSTYRFVEHVRRWVLEKYSG